MNAPLKDGFVADASLALAWAVESQSSEETEGLLEDVAAGAPFFVPVLWACEVANGLLILKRRKKIGPEHYTRARRALNNLNPAVDEDGARLALGTISDLANDHGLTVYDAIYLELAVRKRLPLASLDAALNRAARLSSVKTLL